MVNKILMVVSKRNSGGKYKLKGGSKSKISFGDKSSRSNGGN